MPDPHQLVPRGPRKVNAQLVPDEAVGAVAPGQESGAEGVAAAGGGDLHEHAFAVVLEAGNGVPAANVNIGGAGAGFQQLFQPALRYRQDFQRIGPERVEPQREGAERVAGRGDGVEAPLPPQQATLRKHGCDLAHEAVAFPHGTGLGGLLEDRRGDARGGQLAGKHQPDRAGASNDHRQSVLDAVPGHFHPTFAALDPVTSTGWARSACRERQGGVRQRRPVLDGG